jgi:hypothetical protein
MVSERILLAIAGMHDMSLKYGAAEDGIVILR